MRLRQTALVVARASYSNQRTPATGRHTSQDGREVQHRSAELSRRSQNTIGSVTLDGMLRVARVADDVGYYALWPNEFFTTRPDVTARFGRPAALFDTIVTTAYVAAATQRIRLTPSTIVLPLHEPLLLSRQLATLACIQVAGLRWALAWVAQSRSFGSYTVSWRGRTAAR
jgi:alkanesulfonate monooxygenase SsuD/methylene tetrahydromethanopterin reductase-like flavin-dependent oxidoreductase (luciferase family)